MTGAARRAVAGLKAPGYAFFDTSRQVGRDSWEVDVEDVEFQGLEDARKRLNLPTHSEVILWIVARIQ